MKIEEIKVGQKYWTVHGSLMTCAGTGEGMAMMVHRSGNEFGCPLRPESIMCEFTPEPVAYTITTEYRYLPRPWWRFGL